MTEEASPGVINLTVTEVQANPSSVESAAILENREFQLQPTDTIQMIVSTFYNDPSKCKLVLDENGRILRHGHTLREAKVEDGARLYLRSPPLRSRSQGFIRRVMGGEQAFLMLRWWHFLIWALIAVLVITLTVLSILKCHNVIYNPLRNSYGIVIDAGSTHSSVYLYKWPANRTEELGEAYSCEIEDLRGISSFRFNASQVKGYIIGSNCYQTAMQYVPVSIRNETNVYIGGTGGMRALYKNNPVQARQILGNATAAVNATGFAGIPEVIDGVNEGIYGWISVNSALGSLSNKSQEVGSLDWGGASSQITFPVESNKDGISLNLFNQTHYIYTISHLCYGQEKALNRYFIRVIHENYKKSGHQIAFELDSPCQPRGYQALVKSGHQLFGKCTHLKDMDFNEKFSQHLSQNFTFVGTGEQEKCKAFIKDQFNKAKCSRTYQHHRTCFDVRKIRNVPSNITFYAFSTYWYLAEVFKIPFIKADKLDSLSINLEKFDNKTNDICASRVGLIASWGSDFIHNSCFRAMFMRHLLVDGYGLKDWSGIKFVSRIKGSSIGWSRGFMLTKATPNFYYWRVDKDFIIMIMLFILSAVALFCVLEFPRIYSWFSRCRTAGSGK